LEVGKKEKKKKLMKTNYYIVCVRTTLIYCIECSSFDSICGPSIDIWFVSAEWHEERKWTVIFVEISYVFVSFLFFPFSLVFFSVHLQLVEFHLSLSQVYSKTDHQNRERGENDQSILLIVFDASLGCVCFASNDNLLVWEGWRNGRHTMHPRWVGGLITLSTM